MGVGPQSLDEMSIFLRTTSIVAILFILSCNTVKNINQSYSSELMVGYSNSNIEYSGRIDSSSSNGVDMFWSGTSVKINFEGKSVKALFENEGDRNYYNIILDKERPLQGKQLN